MVSTTKCTLRKNAEAVARSIGYRFLRLIFRNKPSATTLHAASCRKILLCRYDRIGDMIVTTPVINLLREMLPDAEIHVLASPRNSSLLAYDRRVAKVYEFDGTQKPLAALRSLFARPLRTAMRKERYDAVFALVFHKTTMAGLVANILTGAKSVKIGIAHPTRTALYSTLFNLLVPIEFERETMAELQVRLVCAAFGWEYSKEIVRYGVELSEAHTACAKEILRAFHHHQQADSAQKIVFYNCSAGAPARQWSLRRNEECLRLLTERFPNAHFLLNTAPHDRSLGEVLHAVFPIKTTLLPASRDLLDVCALVQHVDAVFTPETSIVHIATMYRKPLVALYSQLSFAVEWLPFGDFPFRIVLTEGEEPIESIMPEKAVGAFGELFG